MQRVDDMLISCVCRWLFCVLLLLLFLLYIFWPKVQAQTIAARKAANRNTVRTDHGRALNAALGAW